MYRRQPQKPSQRKGNARKRLSKKALQIAEKRRETKCKGGKESYRKLNADFQRIARKDKRAFLNEQCKEIEENIRKGKTRELFKKIGDYAKMDMIKDKNGRDLTEAEDIKKSGKDTQRNSTRKIWISWTTQIVWLLTLSQTSWRVKSNGP